MALKKSSIADCIPEAALDVPMKALIFMGLNGIITQQPKRERGMHGVVPEYLSSATVGHFDSLIFYLPEICIPYDIRYKMH